MVVCPPGEVPNVGVPRHLSLEMTVAEQQEWLQGFLRSRRVSRRSALKGAASVLAALGLGGAAWDLAGCGSAGRVPATPPQLAVVGRHLSFGLDPATTMAIAGELTGKPTGKVLLDLGTDRDYGHTLEAEVRELVSLVPQEDGSIRGADQFYVHALAAALRAGTAYHYRFRLPDGSATPDATFRTAPAGNNVEPFTFTAFADQGVNTRALDGQAGFDDNYYKADDTRRSATPADSLVQLIAAQRPAFHLLAGDICYADPSGTGQPVKNNAPRSAGSGFNNFDPTLWTTYFATIEKSAAYTPWMFATGNHDMEALYDNNTAPGGASHGYAGHAARLDLPANGPSRCPSVYSMVYGNVAVISLDANDLSAEIPTNAGYSGGQQLSWLTDTLTRFRADPAINFIVAFFHHCAFATSGTHASDGGVRAALAPLFDRFSVDLVVQGHNHQYERTNPIRDGRSTTQAPDRSTVWPAKDGTTYVCVGSGGRPRYDWQPGETDRYRGGPDTNSGTVVRSYLTGPDGTKTPETVDWSQARYLDYAYLSIAVRPAPPGGIASMQVAARSDLGQEIDRVELLRLHPSQPQ
jgi:Calcineurin-like phosphoesterase